MSTSAERMRALRARKAAGLLPAEGQAPRDPDELLLPAVEETLSALQLGPGDGAAAQLARRYASVIDEGSDPAWCMRWIGPLLLASLESLRATPASRAAAKTPGRPTQLDRLRAARAAADSGKGA